MIRALYSISTLVSDPLHNLALEEVLLRAVRPGQCVLYLWQNQRTVVIGRNQHAQSECRIRALEDDGGHLVRRLSGGGAVYHDLGNLNFTFLTTHDDYDVEKQTEVILEAVRAVGIRAEKTGRNDLTADGQKFSGHAYYRTGDQCYHHGTLMVDVDMAPLAKYLSPSPLKLKGKGVKSVRSRVVNLKALRPELTIQALRAALLEAFGKVYGLPVTSLTEEDLDRTALDESMARFSDPLWIYGNQEPLAEYREGRFDWGLLRLDFTLEDGRIRESALWSDGLSADYLSAVPDLLRGCPLEEKALRRALLSPPDSDGEAAEDIIHLLLRNNNGGSL